jgi:hemolysin D
LRRAGSTSAALIEIPMGYAHVRTEKTRFIVDGSPRLIQAGMTAQADIVTDRRRVIDFFLSPVIKYLDEGLRVR